MDSAPGDYEAMRELICRIKKALDSKRGESIMEAVVSLLILGLLMTTIVTIIRFSLVMTGNSIINAGKTQEEINNLIRDEYTNSVTTSIVFVSEDNTIIATHEIEFNTPGDDDLDIITFYPN